jgi:hypothetical protein
LVMIVMSVLMSAVTVIVTVVGAVSVAALP